MAKPTLAALLSRAVVSPGGGGGATYIDVDATGGYDELYLAVVWEDSAAEREVTAWTDDSGTPQSAVQVQHAAYTTGGAYAGVDVWRMVSPASVSSRWTPTWSSSTRPDRAVKVYAIRVTGGEYHQHAAAGGSVTSLGASLTTSASDCVLVDFGLAAAVTADPTATGGQSVLDDTQVQSGAAGIDPFCSTLDALTPGAGKTITWSLSAMGLAAQVLVAIAPSGGSGEPNPKAASLVIEDFSGGLPASLVIDPDGDGYQDNVDIDSGVLRIGLATGSAADGVVATTGDYERLDLTDSGIVFDVELLDAGVIELFSGVRYGIPDPVTAGYRVYRDDTDLVSGWFDETEFDVGTLDTRTYSTTDHRFLRIRESSGTVYVEASPDQGSWTTLASQALSVTPGFVPESVQVEWDGSGNPVVGGLLLRAINPEPEEEQNTGTLAATVGVSCSGVATLAISAAATAAVAVACIGAGSLAIAGSGAAAVPVVASGSATLPITGTGAATIPVTCSGLGSSDRVASGAITIGVTCTGTGSLDLVGAGTGSIPVTASGSAALDITATGAVGIPVTAAGTGALGITGAGDVTIAVVCSGVGSLIAEGSGALAATIAVIGSGSAQLEISGAGSAVVGVVAQGSAALGISGASASTIPVTCSGTGSLVSPGSGALSATIPVVAEGSGALAISGQGEASVPVVVAGTGSLAISGSGTATIGVTCTGVGSLTEVTHTGTLAVTIPVTAIGTGALDITGQLVASVGVVCSGVGFDPDSALPALPRVRRFTALTQTNSFRATVRSHTLEVPSA